MTTLEQGTKGEKFSTPRPFRIRVLQLVFHPSGATSYGCEQDPIGSQTSKKQLVEQILHWKHPPTLQSTNWTNKADNTYILKCWNNLVNGSQSYTLTSQWHSGIYKRIKFYNKPVPSNKLQKIILKTALSTTK